MNDLPCTGLLDTTHNGWLVFYKEKQECMSPTDQPITSRVSGRGDITGLVYVFVCLDLLKGFVHHRIKDCSCRSRRAKSSPMF